jgi:hypothetical protein
MAEIQGFKFMVVSITSDESHTLGDLIFTASPRAGEFVTKKIEDVEHNYRVKAVVHTPDYHEKTCGLLYVEDFGDNAKLYAHLRTLGHKG